MPASKAYSALLAAGTTVTPGTTKATATPGSIVDARTGYGGELVYRITNGGALGVPCTIMFQTSPDGTNWFDYYPVSSSDLSNGTVTQGPSIALGKGGMYIRAIPYGNTTSSCTVEAGFQQVTGL